MEFKYVITFGLVLFLVYLFERYFIQILTFVQNLRQRLTKMQFYALFILISNLLLSYYINRLTDSSVTVTVTGILPTSLEEFKIYFTSPEYLKVFGTFVVLGILSLTAPLQDREPDEKTADNEITTKEVQQVSENPKQQAAVETTSEKVILSPQAAQEIEFLNEKGKDSFSKFIHSINSERFSILKAMMTSDNVIDKNIYVKKEGPLRIYYKIQTTDKNSKILIVSVLDMRHGLKMFLEKLNIPKN